MGTTAGEHNWQSAGEGALKAPPRNTKKKDAKQKIQNTHSHTVSPTESTLTLLYICLLFVSHLPAKYGKIDARKLANWVESTFRPPRGESDIINIVSSLGQKEMVKCNE